MAPTVAIFISRAFFSPAGIWILFFVCLAQSQNNLVFQPSFVVTTGPSVSALLRGNSSGVTLNLKRVIPSNSTGLISSPSCISESTRWVVTSEPMGKNAIRVRFQFNESRLCGENDTNTDCCPKPLCVLETLQVSACAGGTPQASLLIQATISPQLFPENAASGNKLVIPNQVYQPLGQCPCDLTFRACDVRCCCDKDCSVDEQQLFSSSCLPGPFGGQAFPAADYQCSEQASENSPDWFPFLCVYSPPENNPYLGLFFHGDTIAPRSAPSFLMPVIPAPGPASFYIQGTPIVTSSNKYFSIPQMVFGRCVSRAPVAFLRNFEAKCVTLLHSCPTGPPLNMLQEDLSIEVFNGQGGVIVVQVIDEVASDLSLFVSESAAVDSTSTMLLCENVTLALDYQLHWKGNGLTGITLTRTVGTVLSNGSVVVSTRYSAVFLHGDSMAEPNSGSPGYQVGRKLIGGILGNDTDWMEKTFINIWKPVQDGLCSSAGMTPVLFGQNSTSGCLLPVSHQNLSQCLLLRGRVTDLQATLIGATHVAKPGNPDPFTMSDWLNISFVTVNSSSPMGDVAGFACDEVPAHQHITVWTLPTSLVDGTPQVEIQALQVSYSLSTWTLDCGGGDVSSCEDLEKTQLFSVTSSITFISIPFNKGPPKTWFQINFTEYDCSRNDVCWPELAFPLTKYYTGEPYSLSLAKGMILVFMFASASILGTPWRQMRQVWQNAAL